MPNELIDQTARVGFCWDTVMPDVYPAMLRNTGKEIELVVPYLDNEVLRRRFIGGSVNWGDDPAQELHSYEVPEVVWFADTYGHMCLIGPYRARSTLIGRPDEGAAFFKFAVATGGRGTDYTRINAMHTRIQGLNEWVSLGSVEHERQPAPEGNSRTVIYLQSPPPVAVAPRLNGRLEGWHSWTLTEARRAGVSVIADGVRVATDVSRPRNWDEHLDVHNAIRQLLTVAGWQRYGFDHIEVQSRRDPTRTLDSTPVASRWAPVFTHDIREPADVQPSRYLFEFDDIGASGVRRWFQLRERHSRGIAGMLHSVGVRGGALETVFSEAAASMEHIGHNIALERDLNPGRKIREHVRRIADEVDVDLGFDLNDWRLQFADAYRMVKHPEHPDLDSLHLANLLRQTRLVFRMWVAGRLGAKTALLQRKLSLIPMRIPYERL